MIGREKPVLGLERMVKNEKNWAIIVLNDFLSSNNISTSETATQHCSKPKKHMFKIENLLNFTQLVLDRHFVGLELFIADETHL